MKAVIICGGIGSKMWPESRGASPKQFLPLIGEKSLFQSNWEALRLKFSPEEIFLQTNAEQAEIAKKQVKEILPENVFVEPEMRNQGPATGFAAASLIKKGFGDEAFMLVQADVMRKPEEMFIKMVETVGNLAESSMDYITGGMVPESIVRGVDYLVKGELIKEENGVKVYRVADYIDRSEEEKIKKYLGTDKLMIHANHTTMTPNNLLAMYKKYRMDWYEPLMNIVNGGDIPTEYAKMPKAGIEDVTKQVYVKGEAMVAELPFEWIDFGTWESLAKYLIERKMYSSDTKTIELDSINNFVRANKTVALIGVSDLVVIDKNDALLICKMDKTGKVGEVVDKLKAENKTELL
ncbi:MAG TPA: sugar phosphate nucleotidyltransferase [Candidatus Methanoperedens sp.]|nr:sugar phosphate nucleotidyltransferase [Candidatus Methanoperedens sp.]